MELIDWDNYRVHALTVDIHYVTALFKEWCEGHSNTEDWVNSDWELAFEMFKAGILVNKNINEPHLSLQLKNGA